MYRYMQSDSSTITRQFLECAVFTLLPQAWSPLVWWVKPTATQLWQPLGTQLRVPFPFLPEVEVVRITGSFLSIFLSLCLPGCGLWPGHLPNSSLPVQTVWCPEGWLWLCVNQQCPLWPGVCHHDHEETGTGETLESCLAVKTQDLPESGEPRESQQSSSCSLTGWWRMCGRSS